MKRIKMQRLRWQGHVARMDSSNPVRKVFESDPGGGCRRQGRPLQRCAKQVAEYQAASLCYAWRRKLAEGKTCNRL